MEYFFFWNGTFSNWIESFFTIDGIKYSCGEQYMMYQKAITFNDFDTAKKILATKHPRDQKELGRSVQNFNPIVWNEVRYDLVKKGLKEKFNQNPDMKAELLSHKGKTFVEASPYDRIWGIGYAEENALENIFDWGDNLLGKIITELSNEL